MRCVTGSIGIHVYIISNKSDTSMYKCTCNLWHLPNHLVLLRMTRETCEQVFLYKIWGSLFFIKFATAQFIIEVTVTLWQVTQKLIIIYDKMQVTTTTDYMSTIITFRQTCYINYLSVYEFVLICQNTVYPRSIINLNSLDMFIAIPGK